MFGFGTPQLRQEKWSKKSTRSAAGGMAPNESARPRWGHLEYTWKLENLWELRALASIEALEEDGGDVVWSSRFGDKERGIWRLKLYPYGDSSAGGRGHLSLFLSLDFKAMETPRAYAIFGCYVLDDKGERIPDSGRSFTRQRFAEDSCSWGWSQFIKVEGQSLSKVLINEALIIKCTIDVFLGMASNPGRDLPPQRTLLEELSAFASEEKQRNVQLVCQDRVFDVNGFFLAARSAKFREILTASTDVQTREQRRVGGSHHSFAPVLRGTGTVASTPSPPPSTMPSYTSFGVANESEAPGGIRLNDKISDGVGSTNFESIGVGASGGGPFPPSNSSSGIAAVATASSTPYQTFPPPPASSQLPFGGVTNPSQRSRSVVAAGGMVTNSTAEVSTALPFSAERTIIHLEGVTVAAAEEMVTFIQTDTCSLLESISPKLELILDLLVVAEKYAIQTLLWKLVAILLARLTNERDAQMILEVGKQTKIDVLSSEAKRFLQSCAPQQTGKVLLANVSPDVSSSG